MRKRVAAVLLEVAAGGDDSDGFGVVEFSRESDSQQSSSNDQLEYLQHAISFNEIIHETEIKLRKLTNFILVRGFGSSVVLGEKSREH